MLYPGPARRARRARRSRPPQHPASRERHSGICAAASWGLCSGPDRLRLVNKSPASHSSFVPQPYVRKRSAGSQAAVLSAGPTGTGHQANAETGRRKPDRLLSGKSRGQPGRGRGAAVQQELLAALGLVVLANPGGPTVGTCRERAPTGSGSGRALPARAAPLVQAGRGSAFRPADAPAAPGDGRGACRAFACGVPGRVLGTRA